MQQRHLQQPGIHIEPKEKGLVLLKQEEIKKLEARQAEIAEGQVIVYAQDECHLLWGDTGVTSRARGSRWARSEMTRAVGTLPGWPGRG